MSYNVSTINVVNVTQADETTDFAVGADLTVRAQSATGAFSVGGSLVLSSGAGTVANGSINFFCGAVDVFNVNTSAGTCTLATGPTIGDFFIVGSSSCTLHLNSDTLIINSNTLLLQSAGQVTAITMGLVPFGTTSISVASTVTAFTITQADKTTNSGTGSTFTIQAQNETGTSSTGGRLDLKSGTGTSTNGAIRVYSGSSVLCDFSNLNDSCSITANSSRAGFSVFANTGSQYVQLTALGGSGAIYLDTATINMRDVAQAQTIAFNLAGTGSTSITVEPTVTAFAVTQNTRSSTGTNAGATLTVKAQSGQAQTGGADNNAGGQLVLQSGAAGTGGGGAFALNGTIKLMDGNVEIGTYRAILGDCRFTTGSTNNYFLFAANAVSQGLYFQSVGVGGYVAFQTSVIYVSDAALVETLRYTLNATGSTTLTFSNTITALSFSQNDKTTNGGTGATFTIQAQNETGTGSTGGELALKGGTGTAAVSDRASGGVSLYSGSTLVARAEVSTADGANYNNFLNMGLSGGIRAQYIVSASTVGDAYYNAANGANVYLGTLAAGHGTDWAFSASGTTCTLTINTANTAVTIKQGDKTTNGGTGATFTIQAQNETGTTSTGGTLALKSGTGTNIVQAPISFYSGSVKLCEFSNSNTQYTVTVDSGLAGYCVTANGASQFLLFSQTSGFGIYFDTPNIHLRDGSSIEAITYAVASGGTTSIGAAATVTAFTIFQADKTTNSGTGAALTIQAQNETGTTSIGGALVLQSGTGTSTNGAVTIKAGSTTALNVAGSGLVTSATTWIHVRRSSDHAGVTSSTTVVDDGVLQFSIAANEQWILESQLAFTSSVAGSHRENISVPAGASGTIHWIASSSFQSALPSADLGEAGTTNASVSMKVWIVNGANAGTVKIQFAQFASDGTATIMKAGSYIRAWRVA